jgi:hypothetical protein
MLVFFPVAEREGIPHRTGFQAFDAGKIHEKYSATLRSLEGDR